MIFQEWKQIPPETQSYLILLIEIRETLPPEELNKELQSTLQSKQPSPHV